MLAESRRLSDAMRVLLRACTACESAVASAGAGEPEAAWASQLQRRSDDASRSAHAHDASGSNGLERESTSDDAPTRGDDASTRGDDASTPDDDTPTTAPQVSTWTRRGHPAIRAWVVARKHVCTLAGVRAAVASTVHWLDTITDGNHEKRTLFVGTDGDWLRGTTSFAPASFDLPKTFESARALAEAQSVAMVARLASHGWPAWIRNAASASASASTSRAGPAGLPAMCALWRALLVSVDARRRLFGV